MAEHACIRFMPGVMFLFLCSFFIGVVDAHPQCLDSLPPFNLKKPLSFCSEYPSFGCCSVARDTALFEQYSAASKLISDARCANYLKTFLCQECSPYAAHIFSAESSLKASTFPGLCVPYCREFYNRCKDIVSHVTNDTSVTQSLTSPADFCAKIQLSDKDYCYPDLKTNPVLVTNVRNVQRNTDTCLCVEEFASNLGNPVFLRSPRDGTDRLFVGEQKGLIHIYYPNKTKMQDPFLDMTKETYTTSRMGDERGFFNLAFHPNFANNSRFFIYYFTKVKSISKIRISELRVSSGSQDKADRYSEKIILEVKQPKSNHNGGELLFGDDGYLYIFIGDGGGAGDPDNNGQDKTTLLGTVLRINVDTGDTLVPYLVPTDNPFVTETNTRPEIYAYGVRNIWRCGKDRGDRVTGEGKGRIICGDVGQDAWEEIDIIEKGGNYGWNAKEGFKCFQRNSCPMDSEVLPIHAYGHKDGKSVTGGHVYRGCLYPNLYGYYVYGDFMNGRMWKLIQNKITQKWENTEIHMCKPDKCIKAQGLQGHYEKCLISYGEDANGELYFLTTSDPVTSNNDGKVYRLVDPNRGEDPSVCQARSESTRRYVPHDTSDAAVQMYFQYTIYFTTVLSVVGLSSLRSMFYLGQF